MKSSISYSLLLAAAACGVAVGQTTAYTTPVGYVTINVPAQADTTITPPLERANLLSAASTGISGNDVSVSGLTADAFVNVGGVDAKSYLQVTSGSLAGQRFPITANTTSSITVDAGATTLQALGFASGNSFKVVQNWTLASLFPNGAGVGSTEDVFGATSFVLTSSNAATGTNRASTKLYFYCSGDAGNDLPAGWYDNDDLFGGTKNDVVIDPAAFYTIRSASEVDQSVVISGQVPNTALANQVAVDVDFNDVYLGSSFPVDISLEQSGLQSLIQATSDVFSPVETLFVFDDSAPGVNKAAAKVYFYCSGDSANDLPAGWYDNDDLFSGPVSGNLLKAGRGFIIRKAPYESAGSLAWVAPLPYSL
jgi:uncharacterized protein (TIGR02597 family)